jgi:PAS domain S-box-containing protein
LKQLKIEERRSLTLVSLVFFFLVLGIAASAYVSYTNYERQYRAQVDNQLSAIAHLKVDGLIDWRQERIGDAELLRRSPAFAALVQTCLENPADDQAKDMLQAWLDGLYNAYEYDRVMLLDVHGAERLASPQIIEAVSPHLIEDIGAVLASGNVTFLDFHHDTAKDVIHLALLIPMYAEGDTNQPLGVVVLRINPEITLYPYLKEWQSSSETAETLLVHREDESVVFLNPLRFRPDAALKLRIPVTQRDVLAVKVVLGQTGVMEGRDYRNVGAIGAVLPVPDTPWFLVARIDKSEIYAPLRERLWQTILFFGVMMAASGSGLLLLWRQQRLRHYRSQIETLDALRASEEKFKLAFETSPDAIFITRQSDGLFVSVNKGFEQITGYRREEVLGKTSLEINTWKDPQDRQNMAAGLQSQGEVRNYAAAFLTRDGEIYGLMSAAIIQLDGVPHILTIMHDITERKRTEEQLARYADQLEGMVDERTRELQKTQEQLVRQERLATLGQLAGSIGHELRNPLGVISNAIYFLKMAQPNADAQTREYLDMIENETRTSDKIITDLLDFTRVKSLDRQAVSVSELVRQTLERYPAPPSVKVALEIAPDLPNVYADPRHVIQVLGNLTVNACQAMPNGGDLTLSAQAQGDMIAIAVQDTGTGVSRVHMKKLFEPLFTTKIKGIGLGLAVSQKLAEANGGRIEVQSEPGNGSIFTLFLPIYTVIQNSIPGEESN